MKDSIDRIAVALERIAVALEKHGEPVHVPFPDATKIYGPCTLDPKEWQWTGPTADTRYGDIDRFHSGGIGGGLREGETPTILSRGHAADGRWYGPCEPPKPEDFTILDKGEDVLSKEDAPKGTEHIRQRFGVDYSVMGDDKTSETCRAKFDNMINFGMEPHTPDDRHLTKEEAHALNRAVKRSTIKVHDDKLEKD